MRDPDSRLDGSGGECIARRTQPVRDYVVVSRGVLVGYPGVSDGAKLTYLVIYGHDWYDPTRGERKGYVFPTVGRLAILRRTTPRTIQRHLAELIAAGLLTRELRDGKPSVLYIEEPTEVGEQHQASNPSRGDIPVGGGVTRMSPQEEEERKQDKDVNGENDDWMEEGSGRRRELTPIGQVLREKRSARTATSRDRWLADQILAVTGDAHSVGCYRLLARRCAEDLIFEALALLKEARRDGAVRRTRGALFVAIVRRLCEQRGLADPLRARTGIQTAAGPATARLPVKPRSLGTSWSAP